MEFTLICPNDGRLELGLEDISSVVFCGSDSVEVVFECPHCHSSLRAEVRVPNLLGAAMELARYAEAEDAGRMTALDDRVDAMLVEREAGEAREREATAYCEYFRRQLAHVECVEDLLAEFE